MKSNVCVMTYGNSESLSQLEVIDMDFTGF